jgi:UDP-glucose 4-epimerase
MDHQQAYGGKQVLVNGGAGFLGSHLADALVRLGARVRVLDDLSDGRLDNLHLSRADLEFRDGSVTEPAAVEAAVDGCEFVFHLAANASVPRSSAEPWYDFERNAQGTFRVLEAMRQRGGGRLVFASSAAVYGEPQTPAMAEDHPLVPKSPYGATKLGGEFMVETWGRCYGLDQRRVRIFNTYGPRQRKYVMFDLLEKLRRDPRRLEVIGTGDQVRDYNYVEDTVAAILLVGGHPEARGHVYNIAGGNPISIRALVDLVLELLEIPRPEISYTMQSWQGDVVRMIGDTGLIRDLGFRPAIKLADGVRRLIEWHRREYAPGW